MSPETTPDQHRRRTTPAQAAKNESVGVDQLREKLQNQYPNDPELRKIIKKHKPQNPGL